MKKLHLLVATLCLLSTLLVAGNWSAQPIQAAASQAPASVAGACQNSPMAGSYEFVAPATVRVGVGTMVAIPDHLLYASPAAYASKGTLLFDGSGKLILNAIENINGPLASPARYYGEVLIQSDCSAQVTFADGAQLALKVVGNGTTRALVSLTPGFVILRPAP